MLVENEIFEKLCPSYQTVIQELNENYAVIPESDYVEKLELLKEYFHRYLMLPEIWEKYVTLLNDYKFSAETDEELGYLLSKTLAENNYGSRISRYHLIDDNSPGALPTKLLHNPPKKLFRGNPYVGAFTVKEIEAAVICPRKGMDKTWRFFEEFSGGPIPKNVIEKYKNAQKLYEDIVKVENDQEKWFNLLIQCENKEYVCDNIEARLGKNLNNLQLWKLYFKYLSQDVCKKRLLHLYSRYCRYFLDDFKMKEEYKKATKKYGAIKVFWKNSFDFEIYEKDINLIISDSGHLILNDLDFERTNDFVNQPVLNNLSKPSFETYKIQTFSFPKTIMSFIIENVNPHILQKLQKSCKYFFILRPYPVCHKFLRVGESDDIKFFGHSLQLPNNFYDESNKIIKHKFILSNSFLVNKELFLSKIYKCYAKYIRLWSIKGGITFKEFTFLVGHGNVEVLQLSNVQVLNEDDTPVPLEKLLTLVPKIIEFRISTQSISLQTFKILPMLKFVNKIQLFDLKNLTYFESFGFCQFLKKNMDSSSEVWVRFDPKTDENQAETWGKEVETEINDYCWPGNQKPMIRIFKLNR